MFDHRSGNVDHIPGHNPGVGMGTPRTSGDFPDRREELDVESQGRNRRPA